MNCQKKCQSFTKVSLISIMVAMIMCVGLSAQVMAQNPVLVKVVNASDESTIVANQGDAVDIYIRLDNVEAYIDPANPTIQAIQCMFTDVDSVLNIDYTTDPEGKNIPAVVAFGVTEGNEVLEAWPVYAYFVDNIVGNPINIGLAMNPVDQGFFDPSWYDGDPDPFPPLPWPQNPDGLYYLPTSGKILKISAHVKSDAPGGDHPLRLSELPDGKGGTLAIINEWEKESIPYNIEPPEGSTLSIIVDTIPPTVVSKSPDDGDINVPVSTNITVVFSEAMHKGNTESAFSVEPPVDGAKSWSAGDTTLTFDPTNNLLPGTTYTVTITGSATDMAGNPLQGAPVVWSFTTEKVLVTVSIVPKETIVFQGQDFAIDVVISSGDISINGLSAFLNITSGDGDPSTFLEIVNDPPFTLGDHFSGFSFLLNQVSGSYELDASAVNLSGGVTGEGVAFRIELKALNLPPEVNEVTLDVNFNLESPRATSYTESGVPGSKTPGVSGATITIQSGVQIPVEVPLQLHSLDNECAVIIFKIYQNGVVVDTLQEKISFLREETGPQGESVWVGGTTLTSSVPPGTYTLWAKEWHYLSTCVEDVTIPLENPEEPIKFPLLLSGDSDDSDFIELTDFGTLAAFFFQTHDKPGDYRPPALPPEPDPEDWEIWHGDFTEDGLVDLTDFGNLAANFFKSGNYPAGVAAAPSISYAEAGINRGAEFILQPSTKLYSNSGRLGLQIGEEFEITIFAKNMTDLYSYSFEVIYDGNGLELLQPDGVAAREDRFLKQNVGNRPSLFIARQEDTGLIQRVIVAGSVTGQGLGVHGNGTVAKLRFRVTSDAPGTISLANVRVLDHNLKQDLIYSQKLTIQAVPKHTAILQNYPNPFNPETWIPYYLANDAEVSIYIYNLSGQLIRTLELGNKSAGYYATRDKSAYWNGRNEAGELASSGVYFYTIQAGNFTATRKMILLK